jgi:hypothetical protein
MAEVPDSPENEAACLCGSCPSKPEGGMRLHCIRGRSLALVKRGFCACNWCPLWSCYGLGELFYCDGGDGGMSGLSILAGREEVT